MNRSKELEVRMGDVVIERSNNVRSCIPAHAVRVAIADVPISYQREWTVAELAVRTFHGSTNVPSRKEYFRVGEGDGASYLVYCAFSVLRDDGVCDTVDFIVGSTPEIDKAARLREQN